MSDSTYQACGCGGTLVVAPARRDAEPKREHLDATGRPAPCPSD
ncbi:hypothetical protein [Streptomyces resistomycificus]|nr:hypothetical protein [Streptomyces resistomycificus]